MTPTEEELVHGEVDGLNPSAASMAARALIAAEPAAAALADDLRRMDALFRQVEERVPSPHLRDAILAAVPPSGRTAPELAGSAAGWQGVAGWLSAPLDILERFIGGGVLTRKVMLLGMTGVAIIAIVGGSLLTNAPSDGVAGTMGGDDKISGVQQASRYRGRTMTKRDVKTGDPRVAILLQNPKVRELLSKPEVRAVFASEAAKEFFSSDEFKNFDQTNVGNFFNNPEFKNFEKQVGQFMKGEDAKNFFQNEELKSFFMADGIAQFFNSNESVGGSIGQSIGQIDQYFKEEVGAKLERNGVDRVGRQLP